VKEAGKDGRSKVMDEGNISFHLFPFLTSLKPYFFYLFPEPPYRFPPLGGIHMKSGIAAKMPILPIYLNVGSAFRLRRWGPQGMPKTKLSSLVAKS